MDLFDSIQDKISHIYQTARQRRRKHMQWRELNTEMMGLVMDCLDVRESVITVRRQFEAANRQIQFLRHQLQQMTNEFEKVQNQSLINQSDVTDLELSQVSALGNEEEMHDDTRDNNTQYPQ